MGMRPLPASRRRPSAYRTLGRFRSRKTLGRTVAVPARSFCRSRRVIESAKPIVVRCRLLTSVAHIDKVGID